jgi:aminomethyltransferase
MDETVSPVEAGLSFSIGKRRRTAGGFRGAERVLRELVDGPGRVRIGLRLESRAAARTGMTVTDAAGTPAGQLTSGAFTPSAAASIAMAYVEAGYAAPGTQLAVVIRGAPVPARIVPMPFVPHNYVRPA